MEKITSLFTILLRGLFISKPMLQVIITDFTAYINLST